ncbi:MAG: DUF504 domain-containing protein [Nanoarchaeota archaeon]|nr:DUF504 domain-containing protein [Nanoarchaeota archaeon]
MQYILDLLNKIKWDKKESPEDYSIAYFDRITHKKENIKYVSIKRIEGGFIVLDKKDEESYIPLHRIKEVSKKGVVVWKR